MTIALRHLSSRMIKSIKSMSRYSSRDLCMTLDDVHLKIVEQLFDGHLCDRSFICEVLRSLRSLHSSSAVADRLTRLVRRIAPFGWTSRSKTTLARRERTFSFVLHNINNKSGRRSGVSSVSSKYLLKVESINSVRLVAGEIFYVVPVDRILTVRARLYFYINCR